MKTIEKTVKSKGWDWSQVPKEHWIQPSDEFLPVALRWKELGYSDVLDLGCGRGRHSLFLAGLGFNVTAADLSPEGIEQLNLEAKRQNLENKIKTIVCDMLELPLKNGAYDAVLAFLSITHTNYTGLKKVIAKVHGILKNSGRFYVTFNSKNSPSYHNPAYIKADEYTIIKKDGIETDIPHCYLDADDVIKVLANFNILKIQQIQDYYLQKGSRGKHESYHFFVEAEKKN
jgi:SAM-dependent methyltransferase